MIPIIAYHGVTANQLPVPNWCQIEVGLFEEHMACLVAEHRVLPLKEIVSRLKQSAPLPPRTAALTFDDGFRSVYTNAFPILKRHHLPATVFPVTSIIGKRQPPWPERLFLALANTGRGAVDHDGSPWPLDSADRRAVAYREIVASLKRTDEDVKTERLDRLLDFLGEPSITSESPFASLSWPEIHIMYQSGIIDFGSHTHAHPILSKCHPLRQEEELRVSRQVLLGHFDAVNLFAYPNGSPDDYTEVTKNLLEKCCYHCGCTAVPDVNTGPRDLFEMPRVCIGAKTTLQQFQAALAEIDSRPPSW